MPVLHMFLQGVYSYVASAGINISSLLLFLLKVFPEYVKLTTYSIQDMESEHGSVYGRDSNSDLTLKIRTTKWFGVGGVGGS
jgi:hypothetical protein